VNAIGNEALIIKEIPGIRNLRIVTGVDILNDFPRHVHHDSVAGVIIAGKRKMIISGSDYVMSAGDIFIINSGEPHSLLSPGGEPHSYKVLIIPDDILKTVAADIYCNGFNLAFSNCIKNDPDSFRRIIELFDVLDDADSLLESESVLFSFLEFLVRYHSASGFPADENKFSISVRLAKEYINNNFREQISLGDLSDLTGVSPFHLNRIFTEETGISPHAYQIHRRIEFSKRLLLDGLSIAYVSAESGFSDQSHYTRFFKRITGTTPGRFILYNR